MDFASTEFAAACRRLAADLAAWKAEGRRVAVLGAGPHTAEVLTRVAPDLFPEVLYDDAPLPADVPAGGPKVRPLDELDPSAFEVFAICSHYQQENLADRLLRLGVDKARIRKMYTPAERVLQFRNSAYDPRADLALPPPPAGAPGPGLAQGRWKPRFVNRILLVHPPFAQANRRHKKTMPMGLLALAAWLRRRFPDLHIDLLDAHIANTPPAEIISRARGRHYDLVCLTCWTAQAPMAYAVADAVRAGGEAGVVLGGVHPTLCPEEAIGHADFLVLGEGELPLAGLVDALRRGRDPGEVRGVLAAPDGPLTRNVLEDLDEMPYPAWEILPDWRLYNFPLHVVGGYRFPLMGSRGCPFGCTFCSSPLIWNRKVRWNSPAWVAGQMMAADQRYGVRQFHFWDDNLLLRPGHMEELCGRLRGQGLDYKWLGLSRASDINRNKDLLPLMKSAGCVGMEIGIESFTQTSADMTCKGEEVEDMASAAENLMAAGLAPLYTHMLFTPGEDLYSYPTKRKFLERINSKVDAKFRSDGGLGQLTTPHRGTVFAKEAPDLGMVFSRENGHYVHHRVNFIPNSLLDDRPRRTADTPGSPYPFLNVIAAYVHGWTLADMELYVHVHELLWDRLDGERTVRELAGMAASAFPQLTLEQALAFTALNMVGWARDDRIAGDRHG